MDNYGCIGDVERHVLTHKVERIEQHAQQAQPMRIVTISKKGAARSEAPNGGLAQRLTGTLP